MSDMTIAIIIIYVIGLLIALVGWSGAVAEALGAYQYATGSNKRHRARELLVVTFVGLPVMLIWPLALAGWLASSLHRVIQDAR